MSSANLYGIAVGSSSTAALGLTPIVTVSDPGPNNISGPSGAFKIGQLWVNTVDETSWQLVSFSSNLGMTQATWVELGSSSPPASGVNFLTPDLDGLVTPLAGNINLLGTTNQITTTGTPETITFSVPTTFVAPGSIQSTTGLVAGSTLSSSGATTLATTGASVNTFGNSTGATSVAIHSGTGGTTITTTGDMDIDGVPSTIMTIGGSVTSGSITIGNPTASSSTTILAGTGNMIINTAGDTTLNGVTTSNYFIGQTTTTGSINIGGTAQSGNLLIGGTSNTGTIQIGNSTTTESIGIGTGAAGTAVTIRAGTGQLNLDAGIVCSNVTTLAATYSVTPQNQLIFANSTSNTVTVTLEASPALGRTLWVYDVGGNATINNIIVDGNGHLISQGGSLAPTKSLTTNWQIMTLAYSGLFWNAAIIA